MQHSTNVEVGNYSDSGAGGGAGTAGLLNSLLFMASLRCFGNLGCFSVDSPFHSVHRPISVVPQPPSAINVTIHLFTRALADQSLHMVWPFDVEKLRGSFRTSRRSVLIIHGFLEGGLAKPWVKALVQAFLRADDFNVMVVDWGPGAGLPYHQAVANTRLVGAILAQLISQLEASLNSRPESFHLIGHSLGAHVAGYAGERLSGRLGRITGLDPAQPYFEYTPITVRLDPSDAAFVDVIHTDTRPLLQGGMGIKKPIGHLDFYPNGGRKQPGCGGDVLTDVQSRDSDILLGMRRWLTCRHQRAVELFTSSLRGDCLFTAVKCRSWSQFQKGDCFDCGGGKCAPLGIKAGILRSSKKLRSPRPTKLYLRTTGEAPYCTFHHRISVSLVLLTKESASLEGTLFARLVYGPNEQSRRLALQPRQRIAKSSLSPRSTHLFMGVVESVPSRSVTSLKLRWRPSPASPLTYFNGRGQHVLLEKVVVEGLETGNKSLFCIPGHTQKKLPAGRTKVLEAHQNCTSSSAASDWPDVEPMGESPRDANMAIDDLDMDLDYDEF